MSRTTVATGTFSSRKAADQAVQRLISSGFARNSIELHRHEDDEGYDLEIHTRAENAKHAERLMNGSSSMFSSMSAPSMGDVRHAASSAVQTVRSHPLLLLGAGLVAGFAIYNLIPRPSEEPARRQRPGRSRQRAHADRTAESPCRLMLWERRGGLKILV